MIKNLRPFIDAGWHTVPLQGKLERLKSGKKTVPDYPGNWRVVYSEKKNDKASMLGGAITGQLSGIVAIDCDNPVTYAMFKQLDPHCKAIAVSLGKYDEPTGTFIYKYTDDVQDTFSIHESGGFSLDVYSNNGFIYLPTAANKTKEPWLEMPELTEMPLAVRLLLKELAKKQRPKEISSGNNIMTANCLAPLLKQFVDTGTFMPGLFKIITPRDFRELDEYVTEGYLHPDNVPDGRGSEYLSKVSAILGSDISVDGQLYVEAMTAIHNLWSAPMDADAFDKTIINPMLEGKASIDGEPIWKHNPEWEKYVCVVPSKRQSSYELGFDDSRNMYYVVDTANETFKAFARDSEFMAFLEASTVSTLKKATLKKNLPIINVVSDPSDRFGFVHSNDPTARSLNLFKRTPELTILFNPELYADKYSPPTTILNYLKSLVPETKMRDYLLQFTRRKLTTFEYSPTILYFLGAHGSGKDTYVQILETILGHVARPTAKEFLEMFNGWILDNYFCQLDEYGNQLTRVTEKDEALGKLKAYSGKANVQIRQMRTDGFNYNHKLTFIMTANSNPLILEDGERRIAFFNTPNVLAKEDWVIETGGVSAVHDRIMSEIKDFCYYLATEVPDMSPSAYVMPPESMFKRQIIADSMYANDKLAYVCKHGLWSYLKDLALEHGSNLVIDDLMNQRLGTKALEELYDSLTNFRGDFKAVLRSLKAMQVPITFRVVNGNRNYYIDAEIPPFIGANDDEDV